METSLRLALLYAALAVAVVQGSYWTRLVEIPRPTFRPRVLTSHLVRFLSRLNFVFAASLFSVVFLPRWDDLEFLWWKTTLLFGVLFSFFCYTVELEALGNCMGRPSIGRFRHASICP